MPGRRVRARRLDEDGVLLLLAVVNSMRAEPFDPFGRLDVVAMGEDEMAELLPRPRVDVGGGEAI